MAVVAEDVRAAPAEALPVADPAPLGLAAFALTTFILSGHNATFIPDLIWVGPALFYGGLVQLLAGMWEFRNRNVFGSTAFSTYGGFWLALGIFVTFATLSKSFAAAITANKADLPNALAWFLLAFAIFNLYMLLWSTRVNAAVFGVFLTLQITDAVPRGVVASEKGAWLATSPTGQTISALVSADDRADLAEGACFNDTGVEVGPA